MTNNDGGLPPDGKLMTGHFIGHGTPCRWHGGIAKRAVHMERNYRGAYLCRVCDFPSEVEREYTETMTSD